MDEFYYTDGESVGFTVAVDLGQSRDWSAVVVNERIEVQRFRRGDYQGTPKRIIRHNLVRLHRYPLGTSYPNICRSVRNVLEEQLPGRKYKPELIVDASGVGRPVVDQMREMGLRPRAATITGGTETSGTHDNFRIAKKLLASTLDVVLSEGRLKVPETDPLAPTLVSELRNFTVRVTAAGNETMAAARERDHDDLTIAAALAVWSAEKRQTLRIHHLPY